MLEFLNEYPPHLIYVILFVFLLLCGLGFPMAEELVLLFGGALVASMVLHPLLMLLVNFLGVVIGDVFLFGLGRGVGSHLSHSPRFTAWFARKLERGRPLFARYGDATVFFARFIPGLRAPTFLIAGTMQMPLWRFVGIDMLASLIFVPALCAIGYFFVDQMDVIAIWFRNTERALGTLLVLALLGWLCHRYWERRKSGTTGTPPC
jgi:membrane protein DedA with SNARE-associated domain